MDEHLAQGGCSDGRGIGYEGLRTISVSKLKLPQTVHVEASFYCVLVYLYVTAILYKV